MREGKVKFFNIKNKFGFITDSKTGQEYYVHIKDIYSPVQEGDAVIFETSNSKRGEVAINVKKATA